MCQAAKDLFNCNPEAGGLRIEPHFLRNSPIPSGLAGNGYPDGALMERGVWRPRRRHRAQPVCQYFPGAEIGTLFHSPVITQPDDFRPRQPEPQGVPFDSKFHLALALSYATIPRSLA